MNEYYSILFFLFIYDLFIENKLKITFYGNYIKKNFFKKK